MLALKRIHVTHSLAALEGVRETVARVHHVDPRLFPVYCSTERAIDVVAEYQLGAPEATAADVPPIELTME